MACTDNAKKNSLFAGVDLAFSWGDDQAMTEHATLMAKCAEVLVCPKSRT